MKKKLWIVVILGAVIFGMYAWVKFNPPLEVSTVASSRSYKSVVVGVGNKGIGDVKIIHVSVNNEEEPSLTKIQVSHALQGFIITEDFKSDESEKYEFTNIEDTTIKAGTSPSIQFEKQDNGTATDQDISYGVSVLHNEAINQVNITYKYFGITFNETITITNIPSS